MGHVQPTAVDATLNAWIHSHILDKQSCRVHNRHSICISTRCVSLSRITLAEYTTRNRNLPARASDFGTLSACATLWETDGQQLYIPCWQKHTIRIISLKTYMGQYSVLNTGTCETVRMDMSRVDRDLFL